MADGNDKNIYIYIFFFLQHAVFTEPTFAQVGCEFLKRSLSKVLDASGWKSTGSPHILRVTAPWLLSVCHWLVVSTYPSEK